MEPQFRPGGQHYSNIWQLSLPRYPAADGGSIYVPNCERAVGQHPTGTLFAARIGELAGIPVVWVYTRSFREERLESYGLFGRAKMTFPDASIISKLPSRAPFGSSSETVPLPFSPCR